VSKGLDKLTEGVGKALETTPELYDDLLKPSTQATGKILAIIPETVNAALVPLRTWIIQQEYKFAEVEKLLVKNLETVSPEKIVTPETYVAVPAIQAISYSMDSDELRNLYANLLSKAMNIDTKDLVHPSFVEIIKQLSPIDVRIFENICAEIFPVIDMYATKYPVKDPSQISSYLSDPLDNIGYEGLTYIIDTSPEIVRLSLDNLSRLNLVVTKRNTSKNSVQNEKILTSPYYIEFKKSINCFVVDSSWKYSEYESILRPTNLGARFRDVCING